MANTLATRYRGLAMPIVKKPGGYFDVSYTRDIIRSALTMLLTTRPGERVMEPEYGSRLYDLVFEQNDAILEGFARTEVVEAIQRWEQTRVQVTGVDIRIEEHVFSINVHYRIIELDSEDLLAIQFSRRQ